ncbi:MAG: hypothetical protein ACOCV1_06050 [Bacillota bacterium]
MKKKLLILPGGGDPFLNEKYITIYKLVKDEASKKGYNKIEIISWVGQNSGPKGIMNLKTATYQLKNIINALVKDNEKFDIIGFFWGANVCINTLYNFNSIPSNLNICRFYGIDEFWNLKTRFFIDTSKNKIRTLRKKIGANIDDNFFNYQIPNELLLRDYPHDNEIRIGIGENDYSISSPEGFVKYLKSFIDKEKISIEIIKNAEHEILKTNKNYFNFLFK